MKKILSFLVLLFMVLPCFAVEVSTYAELQSAINSNQADVLLRDDIDFGATSLIATKDINLSTVSDSTHTIKGNTVAPMIEFRGANSTISNINFSSATTSTSVNPAIYVNVGNVGAGQTYSTFTIKGANFEYNVSNTTNGEGGALHINSMQGTNIVNTSFSSNSALGTGAKGGAVYYEGNGDFVGRNLVFGNNIAQSDGGAIYASTITLTGDENDISDVIVGNVFSSNTSLSGNGGAMYVSNATLDSTSFWGNMALAGDGGAIYASTLTVTGQGTLFSALIGDFTGNYSAGNGGAIYVTDKADLKETVFYMNYATNTSAGLGGAIYAGNNADVKVTTNYFIYNNANKGGAIYNAGKMRIADTLLGGNEASSDGGAIYASGNTDIFNSNLEQNVAGGNGGAIYLDNSTLNLSGVVYFINNLSSGTGGAIYANNSTINIDTNGGGVLFGGNMDSTGDNDIVLNGSSTLNINGNGIVYFYGGVTGGTIVSNNTTLDWNTAAAHNGTLNMTGGSLILHTPDTTLGNVTLNNVALNTQNGVIDTLNTTSLNVSGDNPIFIDIDLENNTSDTFNNLSGSGNLTINSYNQLGILTDNAANTSYSFSGANVNVNEDEDFYGPLYVYNLRSTGGSSFQVVRTNRFNPVISAVPLAASAKVLSNMQTAASLYNRIDVMFSRDRLNYLRPDNVRDRFEGPKVNKEDPIRRDLAPVQSENHMAWFIPTLGYQRVDFGNGIDDVKNKLYGGLVGIDFPFWSAENAMIVPTLFAGYLGSRQEYKDVTLNNDSLAVGGMLTLKGYAALFSAQLFITNGPETYSLKQYDGSFDVFSYTASLKGELDLALGDKIMFQPAFTLLYNGSNLQNYKTTNGAEIKSDSFHNLLLVPSAKIMASLSGWYPYLSGNIFINSLQKGDVKANDILLPEYKIGNYVEASLGVENTFLKNYSGYAQVSVFRGGVRGYALQVGLRGYID